MLVEIGVMFGITIEEAVVCGVVILLFIAFVLSNAPKSDKIERIP